MNIRITGLSRSILSGCAAATCLIAAAAPAVSEGPAVSSVNGKISGFGGGVGVEGDEGGLGGIAGSITLPLSYSFGLQIDGAYARIDDGNFGSTGAHVFWRDPDVGLFGVYGGFARLDQFGGQDLGRLGIEAQKFAGQTTLDGALGYRFGDNFVKDDVYGRARLQYYLTDDFMLSAGYSYEGRSFGNVGTEYQASTGDDMAMSLFAEGQASERDNYSVLAGLRIFFGDNMSLKDRHRRQDPDSYMGLDLTATQQAAATAKSQSGTSQPCPFTPAQNLSNCVRTGLNLDSFPMGGFQLVSNVPPSPDRYSQCSKAGYNSKGNPGPASCGCSAAFQAHSACHTY